GEVGIELPPARRHQRLLFFTETLRPLVCDVRLVAYKVAPAGTQGTHAEVVLLAIATRELGFVEGANGLQRIPAHVHAEAIARGNFRQPPRARIARRTRPAIDVQVSRQGIALPDLRHGERPGIVRKRSDRSDAPARIGGI